MKYTYDSCDTLQFGARNIGGEMIIGSKVSHVFPLFFFSCTSRFAFRSSDVEMHAICISSRELLWRIDVKSPQPTCDRISQEKNRVAEKFPRF